MEPEEDSSDGSGRMAGITTISLVLLGVIQIILGLTISKSVALIANGIDCVGDGFVSAVVWVGLRFCRRPADERFHFGYFKIENLASIGAAAVMISLATYITFRSYRQLIDPQSIELPLLGAGVAMIAAVIAWTLGIKKYLESRASNMGSVRLDAFNTIKDGTASFLVVVALLLSSQGYHIADAVVGFVIAGIIITIGFAAIKESSLILVDACDGVCIQRGLAIRMMAENLEGVYAARVVRLRRAGPVFQGEMEIAVSPKMAVEDFDMIRDKIQKMAKENFPEIERFSVSPHPHVKGKPDFDDETMETR